MGKIVYGLYALCMLPVDLIRFTVDCWRYSIEGFGYRFLNRHPDQPCIHCRGMDFAVTPRCMNLRIRYANVWLVRVLDPDLTVRRAPGIFRPYVFCKNPLGYVSPPAYVPLLALILNVLWLWLFFNLLWITNTLPPHVQESLLEQFPILSALGFSA